MDSFLLYKDSSADGKRGYSHRSDIIKDLNLDILFKTMAREDIFVAEKARRITMIPLETPEEIRYRQEIIKDFLNHQDIISELYSCAERQLKALRQYKEVTENNRTRTTNRTSEIIETLNYLNSGQMELIKIRDILRSSSVFFRSEGLKNLLARLESAHLDQIAERLKETDYFITGGEIQYTLQFGGGLKICNATINYFTDKTFSRRRTSQKGWKNLYNKYVKKDSISLTGNETLRSDVSRLSEVTILHVLKFYRPYLTDMIHFFDHFAEEIAFYMGVIRFMTRMDELHIPLAMPKPLPIGSKDTSFVNIYELSMAIYLQMLPVVNSLSFTDNKLTIITGANQGGKSTFLRSYGIAQIMMQCGMPVPAISFSAPIYTQIFTHFTRREDEQLNSGRLREELSRISRMIDNASKNCLFLLNESFASTTEKEGSRIADGILRAFYEKDISTMMVTHLFQLAESLYNEQLPHTTFLVAERKDDGARTFRMIPGAPSSTSYGTDLFKILED